MRARRWVWENGGWVDEPSPGPRELFSRVLAQPSGAGQAGAAQEPSPETAADAPAVVYYFDRQPAFERTVEDNFLK